MSTDIQQLTLDGRMIPATPKERREVHIYISPVAVNISDRAKYLGEIPKGDFVDVCIKVGGALLKDIPSDTFTALKDIPPEEIRETLYRLLQSI